MASLMMSRSLIGWKPMFRAPQSIERCVTAVILRSCASKAKVVSEDERDPAGAPF